jgi:hypothetical protein
VPVVPGLDGVYFPAVPYPVDGIVVPLDENNKAVTTDDVQVRAVIMPYWYWKRVLNYMTKVETAVTALYAAESHVEQPP